MTRIREEEEYCLVSMWRKLLQKYNKCVTKGVFLATQLNSTQLTQLNSVQPSQSRFCLWRHDLQTESTGSLRSLIGDSWVELSCVAIDSSPIQLNSTRRRVELSWVELCRYKHPFREMFNDMKHRAACLRQLSFLYGLALAGNVRDRLSTY